MKATFGVDDRTITKSSPFQYLSMEFCAVYTMASALLKWEHEPELWRLKERKISVSNHPLVGDSTQLTLGRWAESVTEQPKMTKHRKTALEDFFRVSQLTDRLNARMSKKKFTHNRPPDRLEGICLNRWRWSFVMTVKSRSGAAANKDRRPHHARHPILGPLG
jgi:hypothetical protein